MENDTRIKIIERFDSYYFGINNKGAFLLTFNTFLIGALIAGYNDILQLIACYEESLFNLLIGMIWLFSILSMILTIIAIKPYLKSSVIGQNKSNWFFNDVALEKKQDFFDRINNTTSAQQTDDLNNQIYELSKGLRKKHMLIKSALIINIFEIIILLPIIYLILN